MDDAQRATTDDGPLSGLRVVELAGIGPGPHTAMMLADLGADVIRVERPGASSFPLPPGWPDPMLRGRRTITLDVKRDDERAALLDLISVADVLLEGYRPGVAERIGLGPADCHARNVALVYARITGWGQAGPLAHEAGHDLDYLARTGVLAALGRPGDPPAPPLNLVADFGGGSMLAVVGILAALIERQRSGRGQVVDAAMVDGVELLAQMAWSWRGAGFSNDQRGANLLDGGAPFYDTYTCRDGRFLAVAALEPPFFAALARGLGLELPAGFVHTDPDNWPLLRARITEAVRTRDRDEWADVFAGTDACVSPVLTFEEATRDPHLLARQTLIQVDGVVQAAPAPRFSRTPAAAPGPLAGATDAAAVLREWGDPAGEPRAAQVGLPRVDPP